MTNFPQLIFTAFIVFFSVTISAKNSIQKVYEQVNNGVVELHVKALAQPEPGKVNYRPTTENSLGSGALISDKGRILTAAHVVETATEITVIFNDGSTTSGHVVWVDNLIDLAMIQAYEVPKELQPLRLANSGNYNIGEQVLAIGAPYGVSHSLSVGYLSGVRDREPIPGSNLIPRFLQTDAAINQGNSGGPLFNLQGDIIGIVSHILSSSGGNNGLGFAVSIDTIRHIIDSDPGIFLGVSPHLLTKEQALALNNPFGYGLLIQQVVPNSIADVMGLKGGKFTVTIGRTPVLLGGDILLEVAGRPLTNLEEAIKIRQRLSEYGKGDRVTFKYLRNGKVEQTFWEFD
ncbi:S1C family serine protease [Thalassotalea algicola]|uniref:S1C family serine protease n=1 Tax=Thalassotalea algicola TaxID=2716224 RepID=UPI002E2CE733|nr:trypsin-like peptidase domain-containing protein [Thalassotalea algicola]